MKTKCCRSVRHLRECTWSFKKTAHLFYNKKFTYVVRVRDLQQDVCSPSGTCALPSLTPSPSLSSPLSYSSNTSLPKKHSAYMCVCVCCAKEL